MSHLLDMCSKDAAALGRVAFSTSGVGDCWPVQRRIRILSMHEVLVYSRSRCHLCDVVKDTLKSLENRGSFRWREIDIDGDTELKKLYGDSVPVVFIDGRKAFKYHMTEEDFLRRLER